MVVAFVMVRGGSVVLIVVMVVVLLFIVSVVVYETWIKLYEVNDNVDNCDGLKKVT